MMTVGQAVQHVQRKKYPSPKSPFIEEMKKKYENPADAKTPNSPISNVQELKKKYESPTALPTKTYKPKSPKMLKKSKVQQMASTYNSKISQTTRGGDADANNCSALVNKLSPEAKAQPEASLSKPVALLSPRTKSKAKSKQKSTCFVAEDVLEKFTVKDRAQLYTQFIEDMSKINPKFNTHTELMEATNVKEKVAAQEEVVNEKQDSVKYLAQGEVVHEKQESVKNLRAELEARSAFPKQTVSELVMQTMNYVNKMNRRFNTITTTSVKSKKSEDLKEQKVSHISPRIVALRSKFDIKKHESAKSLSHRKSEANKLFKELGIIKPSHKRRNGEMRSYLPIEAYAPPRKIRRTRCELLAPHVFFQNKHLERLFFTWLKDRQESEQESSTLGKLLEEVPRKNLKPIVTSESSTTSSAKHSEGEEYESGLSSLPKITSEESQAETQQNSIENNAQDVGFIKPWNSLRKKKLRRCLTWKKEYGIVETNNKITSTDSDTDDGNASETKTKNTNFHNSAIAEEKAEEQKVTKVTKDSTLRPNSGEVKESVNSANKIKTAYTLTTGSPPPPYNEKETNEMETTQLKNDDVSSSWPSLVCNQIDRDLSMVTKAQSSDLEDAQDKPEPRTLGDSFIDQGFETGSNEIFSPMRPSRKSVLKKQDRDSLPLFIKLGSDSRRVSIDPEISSGFSTPVKGDSQQQQSNSNSSPVQPLTPLKNRRKSLYDSESRRNSLAMQVIREDRPLEHHEIVSPRTLNTTKPVFFDTSLNKTSQFWIRCGDFSLSFDIYYNNLEKIRLLYEIFGQKSSDTKILHFGIDNHKFSVHNPNDFENILKRLPNNKECSYYWFSTGDFAIPFSGKLLSSEKVQCLFQVIKASVEETGILMFGVDEVEFSNVQEFWDQWPKFSLESNYSMLVGLQSGNSNGLEGRSKYAWPHSKPVKVSDLDQSDVEAEGLEENDLEHLSISPNGSDHSDRNSETIISPDSFCAEYENEPLDQLFDFKYAREHNLETTEIKDESGIETSFNLRASPVPDMLSSLKIQQNRLKSVQDKLSLYKEPFKLTSDDLDALKGTPEYLIKLKDIISDIETIGYTKGFQNCPKDQLERFMFFLTRYADICLHSCSENMEKVINALLNHKPSVA